MSQGLMPSCASSTILSLMWLGRGRPLTNTPPSWFTSPYAFTWDGSEMYTSEVLTVDQWESKFCSTQYGVLESGFVRIAATNCFYETNWGFTDRLELQNFAVWWVWANIPLTLAKYQAAQWWKLAKTDLQRLLSHLHLYALNTRRFNMSSDKKLKRRKLERSIYNPVLEFSFLLSLQTLKCMCMSFWV